ncbi:MAG TPA: YihY/virulence factor BrkB family protein [Candidatus Baltobacteraceae bacterium]|jgi:membrane protein
MLHEAYSDIRETLADFGRHNGQWAAAAMAYFTLFAVAPLFIIVVEIAGAVLGRHQQVLDALYGYLARSARPEAANDIRSIVQATFARQHSGPFAQIVGWVLFVLGAVGLFSAFQHALNTIWEVPLKKNGLAAAIASRAVSFGIVVVVALLLLLSLLVNSFLGGAEQALAQIAPFLPAVAKLGDYVLSIAVIAALFAVMYEYLPDVKIEWRHVWPGAVVSAVLFVVGQALLSWYLGYTGMASTFGVLGGIVAFLIWANYSAQIVLLGAEFTHVYARRHGAIRPAPASAGVSRIGSLPGRSQSTQSTPEYRAPR